MISIIRISPVENLFLTPRQERLFQVKEEVKHPPESLSLERTLHQHGFNINDLTNIEKINLFI